MQVSQQSFPVPLRLGPYLLGKRLGGGGMGDVYEATHGMMQSRRVAIKLLKPQLASQPEFMRRFLREIAALGGVPSHPNLVRAEYADIVDQIPFLVMEYVAGIDLGRLVKIRGPLSVADACACVIQAAHGLGAIHQAGLVHRDIKPSNLMVTADGVVKVLDLGLARLERSDASLDDLTSANRLLGTMDYTAPEQAADPRSVDIRADIYSLGCTLFTLLTGRVPYAEYPSLAQKLQAHASVPFPSLPAEMPPALQAIIVKMTAKDRVERFRDPAAVAEALRPFGAGAHLAAQQPETAPGGDDTPLDTPPAPQTITLASALAAPPAPAVVPPRRRSRRPIFVLLACMLALVAIGIVVHAWRQRDVGDPHDVDRLEASQWHSLFAREPAKLIWTQADRPAHTVFNANLRQFFITTHDLAYCKLGTTKRPHYKFQIAFKTETWERVGVFFGYQTPRDEPTWKAGDLAQCQYIAFSLMGDPAKSVLERGRAKLTRRTGDDHVITHSQILKSVELTDRLGEKVLEVAVTRMGLRIFLDSLELRELASLEPADIIVDEDFRGAFGVFTANNSCHFRDARVYLFPASE